MSEPSVDSEFVDEAVASFGATAHFGDPSGEQWALEGGRALVRRPDLAVISVSGADRLTWLTSLASQIVTGLVPGVSRELLILSPEGRVEHWAGASDDGEALHLIVERSDLSGFVAFLDSMRFALRVSVAERDVAVFSSVRAGTNTPEAVASFGATAHFGDPSGEQWALEGGRALVRRPDLAVIAVSGADRLTWLTSLASQIVTGLVPGASRELLILSPEGRVEHWAGASDDGETLHLIVERSDLSGFVEFLDSMRFALRVSVAECDVAVFSSVRAGANTPEAVAALPGHLWTWEDPWPGVVEGGAAYFQGERHPGARTPMMFHAVSRQAADEFEAAWLAGGAASGAAEAHAAPSSAPPGARSSTPSPAGGKRRRAGYLAWEAMRIAAWKPRLGRETDARAIPPEVDWLRTAVHTAKGCYRGQETIARVINLGRPPRRLTYLQLDGSRGDLPAPGTPITVGGRQVGVITSSARHADEGPIALALIARAVPVSTVFDIDGVAAAQEEIVPVHGKSSVSPQTRPGADLSREAGQRGGSTGFGGLGSALGSR